MKILIAVILTFTISSAFADSKKNNGVRNPASTNSDLQVVIGDINFKFQIIAKQLVQKPLKDEACTSLQQSIGEFEAARIIADRVTDSNNQPVARSFSREVSNIQASAVNLTGFCGNYTNGAIKKNDKDAATALSDQILQSLNSLLLEF